MPRKFSRNLSPAKIKKNKVHSNLIDEDRSVKVLGIIWSASVRCLRADVCKYRPEAGKIKFVKNPPKNYVDSPRYSSNENINFSFIG